MSEDTKCLGLRGPMHGIAADHRLTPDKTATRESALQRGLTTREQIILLQNSKLNGHVFPPWKNSPSPSDFDITQFEDTGELSLSALQLDHFDDWRRPEKVVGTTMVATKPMDLVQDITTDCSIVASLCAASIIIRNVFPRDPNSQQPILSSSGKYMVKLYFNGCPRKVVIDDRLPASRTERKLHVVDRNSPGLLWPALVEKAYLKVRGGYDFPGSNSGTDLWVLTGWVPEQLFIQSDHIVRNALWRRIYAAFNYGDVLITMGTGKMTQNEERGMGLAGEHDYAVMDMKELEGQQLFLMKNPWSGGTTWKGHSTLKETITEIDQTLASFHVTDTQSSTGLRGVSLAPGMFWIGLNDVFQSFESIYLNWNPKLFSSRQDVHCNWDLATCSSPGGSFVYNPQYVVQSKAGGTVWLLLSRHFSSSGRAPGQDLDTALVKECDFGFISLYAFDNNGDKVIFNDGPNIHSPYVDAPNTLLKFDLPPTKPYTIVISGQALPRLMTSFSLSVFSLMPLILFEAREKFPFIISRNGAWTYLTAGGNANSLAYNTNPQYKLHLAETSDISLQIESNTDTLPVHVKLVWAKGDQIQCLTTRDILGDSGEYRKGFAFASIRSVLAGVYTIICSTFEQGQLGSFTLRVQSMSACTVEIVPTKSAGCFGTMAHLAVFTPGIPRLLAPLISRRLNRLSTTARSRGAILGPESSTYSPLKLSVEYGQGPSKTMLGTSDEREYLDGRAGVCTPQVDIQPYMCAGRGTWLVVERLACSGLQSNECVEVEVLSEEPIEIQPWGIGDG